MLRQRLLLACAISSLSLAVGIFACHDTENLPTLCTENPARPDCQDASADAGADVTPFTADSTRALENAKVTCAWIAACETPFGDNETGRCLANAILAFDQTTNANRKPKGDAQDFWRCAFAAATAKSCAQIESCAFGGLVAPCGGGPFVGCAGRGDTRVICDKAGSGEPVERCAAYGKSCGALDPQIGQHDALCTGPQGRMCQTSGCMGAKLSACDDAGTDLGQDCALVGAGACVPDAGACMPESSEPCTPTADISCDDAGVAYGCATGLREKVDCTKISGPGGCTPVLNAPGWMPPSAACKQAAGCGADQCNGTSLNACVRGRFVAVDCAKLGLGACTSVMTTTDGTRYACAKP
jgi:hypothetical protein